MTTVSALVSAYFCEDYLKERLKNLLQLSPMPEIIVCCQDPSPEWDLARVCPVITVIPTKDVPTWGAAINLCIQRATGDYLTTANADDIFYPQGLNYMAAYLDEHPECGIVHGELDVREPDGRIHYWKRVGESVSLKACRVGPFPLWRRSLHKDFGYFDEQMIVSADYDFWLRCRSFGVTVARIPETIGLFQRRADNIGGKNREARAREDAEIRRRYESRTQPVH